MSAVNVRIGACGCWYPTHFPHNIPTASLEQKEVLHISPLLCVIHQQAHARQVLQTSPGSRRKILVLEHIEDVKYFHVDPSVKSRLAKCVGLLVKNTNKGERAGLKRTRRMSQPFPRRGSNGDKCCFRNVRVLANTTDYDVVVCSSPSPGTTRRSHVMY